MKRENIPEDFHRPGCGGTTLSLKGGDTGPIVTCQKCGSSFYREEILKSKSDDNVLTIKELDAVFDAFILEEQDENPFKD